MPSKNPERAKALANSYSEATAWLIEQHKDEFNARRREILQSKYHVDWSPPLTQEQKDEQALAELLKRNPALLDSVLKGRAAAERIPDVDPHS